MLFLLNWVFKHKKGNVHKSGGGVGWAAASLRNTVRYRDGSEALQQAAFLASISHNCRFFYLFPFRERLPQLAGIPFQ
jgi:hypothetical protein